MIKLRSKPTSWFLGPIQRAWQAGKSWKSAITHVIYRGFGNIRTGNIRTKLEIFGQLFVPEIFVGNIRTDFIRWEVSQSTIFSNIFYIFFSFDCFHSCRQNFDCLNFDFLSNFGRLGKPNYWIELDENPKLPSKSNFVFQNRASNLCRIIFSS